MMKYKIVLPLLLLINFASCQNRNKTTSINEEGIIENENTALQGKIEKCTTPATVKNMAGLDGCGFVFRLDNGEVLLPDNEESLTQKLYDDQKVRISYTYLKGRVSACMAGKIVSIDCIEEVMKSKE